MGTTRSARRESGRSVEAGGGRRATRRRWRERARGGDRFESSSRDGWIDRSGTHSANCLFSARRCALHVFSRALTSPFCGFDAASALDPAPQSSSSSSTAALRRLPIAIDRARSKLEAPGSASSVRSLFFRRFGEEEATGKVEARTHRGGGGRARGLRTRTIASTSCSGRSRNPRTTRSTRTS